MCQMIAKDTGTSIGKIGVLTFIHDLYMTYSSGISGHYWVLIISHKVMVIYVLINYVGH